MSTLGKSFPTNVDKLKSEIGGSGGGSSSLFKVNFTVEQDPETGELYVSGCDRDFSDIYNAVVSGNVVEADIVLDIATFTMQVLFSNANAVGFAGYLYDDSDTFRLYSIEMNHSDLHMYLFEPGGGSSDSPLFPVEYELICVDGVWIVDEVSATAEEILNAYNNQKLVVAAISYRNNLYFSLGSLKNIIPPAFVFAFTDSGTGEYVEVIQPRDGDEEAVVQVTPSALPLYGYIVYGASPEDTHLSLTSKEVYDAWSNKRQIVITGDPTEGVPDQYTVLCVQLESAGITTICVYLVGMMSSSENSYTINVSKYVGAVDSPDDYLYVDIPIS